MNRTARTIDDEEIIDLGTYVRALQRRWKLALAGTLIGGALAFGLAMLRPLRYEGTTTLLVVPPSQPTGAQINPATFRAIVENTSLAAQVIAELKLGNAITPQRFVEEALNVEEVRGTNIVKVKVTLDDPATAAEASRRVAQKAILLAQQITQQEGTSVQEQLKNHLGDAHDRMQKAEEDLLAYKQQAQVDLIKEDTDAMLKERGDLLRLVVDIAAEHARLEAAEQEIKRQQPLLSAARNPSAEEALRRSAEDALRAAEPPSRLEPSPPARPTAEPPRATREPPPQARTTGDPSQQGRASREPSPQVRPSSTPSPKVEANPEHLDLSNPFVNPVYQTLDFQIATSRTRIAALEKQRDELINAKKLGGKELSQLSDLYRRQIELARLEAAYDLTTKIYGDLALRYEQSRTQPFGNAAQLQVVDSALPPDHPASRKRLEYGVLGAVFGFLGAAFVAVLSDRRREQPLAN